MDAVMRKPPGKNAAKWNWPLILGDVDSGMRACDVADKYLIPIGTLKEKLRTRRKEMAEKARVPVSAEEGRPAPCIFVTSTGEKKLPVAISAPECPDLTLLDPETVLSDPLAVMALSPETLEKLAGRKLQGMLAAALISPPEVRTLKDLATVHKMFREANGLTGDKGKGGAGLLSPPRSFGRRAVGGSAPVIEAVEVEAFEWPEGMLD